MEQTTPKKMGHRDHPILASGPPKAKDIGRLSIMQNLDTAMAAKLFRLYTGFKKARPNMVFLFLRGNVYEAYYGDAELLSRQLNLDLEYFQSIPICRIPVADSSPFIQQMLHDSWDVGICERDDSPNPEKNPCSIRC
jgi:DNA mismatch repair ATPase MutS